MKRYDFDEIIDRKQTNCVKYDGYQDIYGADNLIPLWVRIWISVLQISFLKL